MTPKGYKFHSFPRCSRRGGGIAMVYKCSPKSVSVKWLNYQCLEAVQAKLLHSSKSISCVCLPQPSPSKVSKFTEKMFLGELSGLIAHLANGTGELVIVGDFNFHFVIPVPMLKSYRPCSVTTVWHSWSCPHVKQLQTLFSDYCLTQLIRDPTRCHGHILGCIVLLENNGSVSQCRVLSTSFSDHNAIVDLTALNNSLTHCWVVSSRNQLSQDASWHPTPPRHWTCRQVQCRPPPRSGPICSTDQQKSDQPAAW